MRWHSDRGSATTELVLVTPILLALLGLVVFAGRVGGIEQQVLAAADEAARAATLQGGPDLARAAAVTTVEDNLGDAGVSCRDLTVSVDTDGLRPGGYVTVTVRCTVGLDDVVFAGMPGARSYEASASEVVDRWRGSGP